MICPIRKEDREDGKRDLSNQERGQRGRKTLSVQSGKRKERTAYRGKSPTGVSFMRPRSKVRRVRFFRNYRLVGLVVRRPP